MTIEEIKELCGKSIDIDEYFSCGDFRKALYITLKALENVSDYNEYYSGVTANTALEKVKKLFE